MLSLSNSLIDQTINGTRVYSPTDVTAQCTPLNPLNMTGGYLIVYILNIRMSDSVQHLKCGNVTL